MAHFNFVINQNAKWEHVGFYIDCHRMTVPENILLQKKHCRIVCDRVYVTARCPSVRLSVCPIYRPLQQRAAGLLPLARRAGDCCCRRQHGGQQQLQSVQNAAAPYYTIAGWCSTPTKNNNNNNHLTASFPGQPG